MKAIKNITEKDIIYPFDFNTYTLPMGKAVFVPDDLSAHLQEQLPMSFDFNYKAVGKTPIPQVRKVKTKSFIPTEQKMKDLGTEDMRIQPVSPKPTFGNPDALPNGVDKDGVDWYGSGIEIEGAAA